jgi:hypothetical protein
MTEKSLEEQRLQAIIRLKGIREKYSQAVSDVPVETATRGTEWSIVDLLRHSTGGYYKTMLSRLLEEDNPSLSGGGGFDAAANWQRVMDGILGDIDGVIDIASKLTIGELAKSGQRGDQEIGVLDVFELMSKHYVEHLNQLVDEIRPREGLSRL